MQMIELWHQYTFKTIVKAKQTSVQLVANFSEKQRKILVFALYEFERNKK